MRKIHCDYEGCEESTQFEAKKPQGLPDGWGRMIWGGMEEGETDASLKAGKIMIKAAAMQMPVAFEGKEDLMEEFKPDPVPVILFAHICPAHMNKIPITNAERQSAGGYGEAQF